MPLVVNGRETTWIIHCPKCYRKTGTTWYGAATCGSSSVQSLMPSFSFKHKVSAKKWRTLCTGISTHHNSEPSQAKWHLCIAPLLAMKWSQIWMHEQRHAQNLWIEHHNYVSMHTGYTLQWTLAHISIYSAPLKELSNAEHWSTYSWIIKNPA